MNECKCSYCGAVFAEDEMTRSDYRDGCCPYCGMDGVEVVEPEEDTRSLDARRRADFGYKPSPIMDWDMIRRAKVLCRNCDHYDHFNLGCKLWLIPMMNCPKRRVAKKEARVLDKRNLT